MINENEDETLINQIHINSAQLQSLYFLSRTDTFNILIYIFFLFIMLIVLILIFCSYLFVDLENILRKDIIEYSGSLVIFLILGITNIFRLLIDAWWRKNKIGYLIHQQKEAISYAKNVLDNSAYE